MTNESGPALHANRLHVQNALLARPDFRATGRGRRGAIQLRAARIGHLELIGSVLTNDSGPALLADRIRIEGAFFTHSGLIASGTGESGAIQLTGAHIGMLGMEETTLTNQSGPALRAEVLEVDGDAWVGDKLTASGNADEGAIILRGAKIGGRLDLAHASISNPTGLLVDLSRATATALLFTADRICPARQDNTTSCPHEEQRIGVTGFVCTTLLGITWREWLHLLRRHTTDYAPSPYQQLAGIERAAGHDGNARLVLITQQQDLHARGQAGGRLTRAVHTIWGMLAGYGYRARRTAMALVIALLLAGMLGLWAGHWVSTPGHHAAERTTQTGDPPGTPCSPVEQFGLGIDRGLPLALPGSAPSAIST